MTEQQATKGTEMVKKIAELRKYREGVAQDRKAFDDSRVTSFGYYGYSGSRNIPERSYNRAMTFLDLLIADTDRAIADLTEHLAAL